MFVPTEHISQLPAVRGELSAMTSNDCTEELVQERTEALLQANEQLWSEVLQRWSVEEELRQSEQTLRRLSSQLLNYQEIERKRIAKDLHDGLSQSLTAIKISIENGLQQGLFCASDDNVVTVSRILGRIQSAIEELHRISTNLYPSMLDDLGVIPTISWCCRQFHSWNSNTQLNTYIDLHENEIPARLKPVIYRILLETLKNIAQHAGADYASVHLRKDDSHIELLIMDSGTGFDESKYSLWDGEYRGTGIADMRWRTDLSGGSLTIVAERNAGTTIRVTWPLPN